MTDIEIFTEISKRQIQALMFHNEMADYFDFLGLNGFKRMHEYQYFKESAEMRGTHRYILNHLNKLVSGGTIASIKVIPESWYNYKRSDVDVATRKTAVKDALQKYYEWEQQTLNLYENYFVEMSKLGKIAYSNKIMDLICDVDKELKCVCRMWLKYKATDFDMTLIEQDQDELHKKYKNKTKEIGVDIT
jgi:hypothetical protein